MKQVFLNFAANFMQETFSRSEKEADASEIQNRQILRFNSTIRRYNNSCVYLNLYRKSTSISHKRPFRAEHQNELIPQLCAIDSYFEKWSSKLQDCRTCMTFDGSNFPL